MVWLQRIVNGGGTVSREYAAGLDRLDLCIDFSGERFAFELKLNSLKAFRFFLDRMYWINRIQSKKQKPKRRTNILEIQLILSQKQYK